MLWRGERLIYQILLHRSVGALRIFLTHFLGEAKERGQWCRLPAAEGFLRAGEKTESRSPESEQTL